MKQRSLSSAISRFWLIALILTLGIVVFVVARRPPPGSAPAGPAAASPETAASPVTAADMAAVRTIASADGLAFHIDTMTFAGQQVIFSGGKLPNAAVPSSALTVGGWAVDTRHAEPGAGIGLLVDGKTRVAGIIGIKRADVASAMHSPAVTSCGFAVTIPAALLPRGRHTVSLLVLDATRQTLYRTPDIIHLDVR